MGQAVSILPIRASDGTGRIERLIGTDLAPGTYRTTNTNAWKCYFQAINRVGIRTQGYGFGPHDVTLYKFETFQSQGCGDWYQIEAG